VGFLHQIGAAHSTSFPRLLFPFQAFFPTLVFTSFVFCCDRALPPLRVRRVVFFTCHCSPFSFPLICPSWYFIFFTPPPRSDNSPACFPSSFFCDAFSIKASSGGFTLDHPLPFPLPLFDLFFLSPPVLPGNELARIKFAAPLGSFFPFHGYVCAASFAFFSFCDQASFSVPCP